MKTLIRMIVVSVLVIMTGCSGVPEGNDSDVKDIVLSLARQQTKQDLAATCYSQITGQSLYDSVVEVTMGRYSKGKDPHQTEVNACAAIAINKVDIELDDIMVESIDDKVGKSMNSATLIIDDARSNIKYTAQLNTDGDVYVEVFGL